MQVFIFLSGHCIDQINRLLAILFLATLSLVNVATLSMAAMPFSTEQKADIIERINICREPKFNDGYETSDFKLSIFEEQDGSFIYCGYHKTTKAKIVLPVIKGEANSKTLWKAVSKNIEYSLEFSSEATSEFRIVKNGSVIYKAEAWSIYPP